MLELKRLSIRKKTNLALGRIIKRVNVIFSGTGRDIWNPYSRTRMSR